MAYGPEPASTGDKRDNMSAYASYQRLSRLPPSVRYPLAAVGPGFPVIWRFLSCQNFSIKRTPERTLVSAVNPFAAGAPSRAAPMLRKGQA